MPISEDSITHPWEKLDSESDAAYALFLQFRDLGPNRTTAKMRRLSDNVEKYAAQFNWKPRAKAFDDFLRIESIEEIKAQHKKHVEAIFAQHEEILSDAREIIADEMTRIMARVKSTKTDGVVKFADLLKLMELTFKNDRLAHDKVTEKIETLTPGPDVNLLTLDEVRTLVELHRKAGADVPDRLIEPDEAN